MLVGRCRRICRLCARRVLAQVSRQSRLVFQYRLCESVLSTFSTIWLPFSLIGGIAIDACRSADSMAARRLRLRLQSGTRRLKIILGLVFDDSLLDLGLGGLLVAKDVRLSLRVTVAVGGL